MHATITRLDPPHLLETTGDPHGVLRWELRPDGSGTLLTFSSTVELPEAYRSRVLAGWHWHLDALAGFPGGTRADPENVSGWEPVHQRYA
jgi:hypothetical protein